MRLSEQEFEKMKKAVLKRALGYVQEESCEDYSADKEGKLVMTKQKIAKKVHPPDIAAAKLLMMLDDNDDGFDSMSEEELLKERQRLIDLLGEDDAEK